MIAGLLRASRWVPVLCVPWVAAAVVACIHVPGLLPDTRSPADFARELTPKCTGYNESEFAPLLTRDAIDSVDPSIAHVKSGSVDPEARLRGARLHLRPLPGFSRESLARRAECHEARVVLGQVLPVANDPYVLPQRWLDIDVDSERDGFIVRVEIDEMQDGRRVLDRARRFLAAAVRANPATAPSARAP